MPASLTIRVRLSEGERSFETWDAVEDLVRAGTITASTEVCVREEDGFGPARAVPELAGHFDVDPWAAWDDADEDSMKQALEGFAEDVEDYDGDVPTSPDVRIRPPAPLELAESSIQPLEGLRAPQRGRDVEELPVAALRPMDDTGSADAQPDPADFRGRVYSFPGGTRPSLPEDPGEVAPGPRLVPPAAPSGPATPAWDSTALQPGRGAAAQPEPADTPRTRWGRVAVFGGSAVVAMLVLNSYVTSTATLTFPPLVEAEPARSAAASIVSDAPGAAAAPAVAPSQEDRFADLDREIRGQWLEKPREVEHPGDLEDALYVELPRLHIDLVKARAPITAWGGRKGAVPQAANFLVRYRARPGELDRELAAIGLLIGRYLSIYRIDGEQFTVEVVSPDESLRRVAVDPKSALRLYEQRIDIVDFLQALR